MRKRGIIGTLLLLVYLAGVGLFTGPSLAQIFLGLSLIHISLRATMHRALLLRQPLPV